MISKADFVKNFNLEKYTTIKVGGFTEYFAEPKSSLELIQIVKWAKSKKITCRIIGAGSNLLIKNTLLKGLTICTKKLNALSINPKEGIIDAECGVMLPTMSNVLAKNSCKGGEWTIGVPGTVGGAIHMNAGTGENSIGNNLISVKAIDIQTLEIKTIEKKDISFAYRYSSFQENDFCVLSAQFYFKPRGNSKKIIEMTKNELRKRVANQPYDLPSFGSVFKNPNNNYAGKLIEEVGLKGLKIGGAEISKKHANFIINNSFATSEDIINLITLIQEEVLQKKGILLEPEVRMIGFDYP